MQVPAVPAVLLAALLSLAACGSLSGLDPFATVPPPPATRLPGTPVAGRGSGVSSPSPASGPASDDAPAAPDGRYAGLAILTAFHGDCNAGGTGEIVVHGSGVTYRDALTPGMSGGLGPHGEVDLSAGPVRLTGRFEAAVFTGRIAGGACEYQMRFERVPR